MRVVCDINKCNGCFACVEKCPMQCISICDSLFSINAIIDESKCINCNNCSKVCPNIHMPNKVEPMEWYQGWATDNIRKNSSSGGVATAIINGFINNGDYVAACVFDGGKFEFCITNNIDHTNRFSGSKYVKSNPRGIYKKIEEKLKTNKVLFVGLPCQVAGVKNYISDQQNLFTIDLICHGTPSNMLLERFLAEREKNLYTANDIRFRENNKFGIVIDGEKITAPKVMDDYTCAFLKGIGYTENCYSCSLASYNRVADITLGDSWGTEYLEEEKKGISLVLIQSDKGKELIKGCELELRKVDIYNAVNHNKQLVASSNYSSNCKKFKKFIEKGMSFKKATFLSLPGLVIKQRVKYYLSKLGVL